ncbi:hypothetical protein [Micromonospora sp. DT47]|uniref:hypothetical protein n=1 Tax=Micromonospora sp. DT47 TaxID=3393431 RepID=UPI003CF37ED6
MLGIPIVGNARNDVTEVWRLAERQLAEQYAAHDETRRMGLSLNEAQDVRARLPEAHDEVAGRIEAAKERVAELETLLREQQKAERLLGNLDRLRTQESDLELREQEAADAVQDWDAFNERFCMKAGPAMITCAVSSVRSPRIGLSRGPGRVGTSLLKPASIMPTLNATVSLGLRL